MNPPECTAAGIPVIALDAVDSTNAEALRQAAAGRRGPLWIRSRQQTAGRGRQGRAWASPPGNLYCSLLVETELASGNANGLSFVAALAVYDTVASFMAEAGCGGDLRIKWPNDVLLDGAKLSGILLEGTSTGEGGMGAMAVGMGINVAHHPRLDDYRTTCLADAGIAADQDAVFVRLAGTLDRWMTEWDGGDGFALVRDAWLTRAGGIGEEVQVRLPNERLTGTFVGLDDGGAMVLRDVTGNDRHILAGDLFLKTSSTDGGRDV